MALHRELESKIRRTASWPSLDNIPIDPMLFYRKKTEPKEKYVEPVIFMDEPYGEESILPIDDIMERPSSRVPSRQSYTS